MKLELNGIKTDTSKLKEMLVTLGLSVDKEGYIVQEVE